MKVTLAESAVRDLEEIVAHYKEQGVPDLGADLVAVILDRIESLSDYPDSGRVVPKFDNPRLRELIHPPFRIVCRRDEERIRIVRVWRSERVLRLPRET
ncbi:MAG TPA: type II toxin-antitoxin system RelE/ParE family toxin [Vicinamibacteria bacterium]|nr:type II toxin-antitoxin system RelE/ParE family toxin [Vicinamibacteria bacterium]